ncbi:MAG: SPW repeat protein [Patescibacteria group bacterium]
MRWIGKVQIILGIWILVSPWILGFAEFSPALWNSVVAGTLTAVLGLWTLFGEE